MSTNSIERPEDVKQRAAFVADAVASRTETFESGKGYSMAEVHAYIQKRARGQAGSRPQAKAWRR